ncbi:hypothetical protein [Pseudomonas sp.]|uniref:hypothetical protein n=1 Tax=Pseudomonas sp. TaxID=306 RepID=UPI003FD8894B
MDGVLMTRVDYQNLRFTVENQIADHDSGHIDSTALANSIMRVFLQAISVEQVKSQVSRRQLLTFRRDKQVTVPAWAFRVPGTIPAPITKGR